MRYIALIDGTAGAYGVVFPDIPGCTAMGATLDEAIANAADALREIVELMEADALDVPVPRQADDVRRDADVAAALAEGAMLVTVPLVRETGRPAKANLSIDAGVLAAIDAEAARRKLTRSAFVEMMARHALAAMA